MPDRNDPVLAFLRTRRSRPAKTLTTPVPERAEIEALLEIAARTPDHKKLEPWRFIVLQGQALDRLADLAQARYAALALPPEKADKARGQFADADLVIAVVAAPKPSDAVPEVEQTLSAGAVCLALLNGALASGWGASWLSGPLAFDREFVQTGLNLAPHEFLAGFIHIGTQTRIPPERPRPDLARITEWVET